MIDVLAAAMLLQQALAPASGEASFCSAPVAEEVTPIAILFEPFDLLPSSGASSITLGGQEPPGEYEVFLVEESGSEEFELLFEANANEAAVTRVRENSFLVRPNNNEAVDLDIVARVAAAEPPSPGDRALTYRVDMRDVLSNVTCTGQATLPVSISVPARAQLNIAGTDSPFTDGPDLYTINFGSLATDMIRTVFVQLRANTEAVLEFGSKNGGRMVSAKGFSVPYSVTLDGAPLDLSTAGSTSLPPAPTMRGRSMPFSVRIGDVQASPAGIYEDIVTITVAAY